MNTINKAQFHKTLQAATRQQPLQYANSFNITVRWKADDTDDNTKAEKATNAFQTLLRVLNLPEAHELVLTDEHVSTPGRQMQSAWMDLLEPIFETEGRSLVIFQYVGHGRKASNCDDSLFVQAKQDTNIRGFNMDRAVVDCVTNPDFFESDDAFDVLLIFDCDYYAFAANRDAQGNSDSRIVEVIAASDNDTNLPAMGVGVSSSSNTFTRKLLREIKHRQKRGDSHVEIADVIQTLRSDHHAHRKPGHGLKMGCGSICIPFANSGMSNPAHIAPVTRVMFGVSISDTMTKEEADQTISWLRTLPPNVSMTLVGVYESEYGGTFLTMIGAWGVRTKLDGIKGYRFCSVVQGANLLTHMHTSRGTVSRRR